MTELRVENLSIPGAPLGAENPLPFFRDPQVDRPARIYPSLPPEKRRYMGWRAGFRVLPYRMQDSYTRSRAPLTFRSIVLENEHLRAIFLPELGGRLISLAHKPLGRELLFRNPVFQPANLAIRNAWFAGGIEWNIGQYGHTFSTCAPLFAAAIRGPQGEPGLRLYEFERCKRLFWQIDFYLPPDSPLLIAYTRVVNPNDAEVSMYWWTNIAVPEAADVRVLAPARQAIYVDFGGSEAGYGYTDLPGLPSLNGADGTYALNSTFANEFFFQCDDADPPWEAALDGQGAGLFEVATGRLKYRKLFCWGSHQGGRRWQEFLSAPGRAYLEIQAGLAPSQLHGLPMPALTTWDWTQVFGCLEADRAQAHSDDWETAWRTVDRAIKGRINPQRLARIEEDCRRQADLPAAEILAAGPGWGALELQRRARDPGAAPISPALIFPESTLGPEQAGWLGLLRDGRLAAPDPADPPGAWMVQPEWRALLEQSLADEANRNWYALLHAGVMALEHFDETGAAAAWQESIQRQPSAWAYRNLAILAHRQRRGQEALAYYERAWELASAAGRPERALAQEYLELLCAARQFARAGAVYESLPAESQAVDRIQILRGRIAMELGDLETVERVLRREYAVVREGETELTDLWFELWMRRVAAQTGRAPDAALRREVEQSYPPPAGIDFRMIQ
jgi:tetratricopeptide (TPR) repeat protein